MRLPLPSGASRTHANTPTPRRAGRGYRRREAVAHAVCACGRAAGGRVYAGRRKARGVPVAPPTGRRLRSPLPAAAHVACCQAAGGWRWVVVGRQCRTAGPAAAGGRGRYGGGCDDRGGGYGASGRPLGHAVHGWRPWGASAA